MAFRIKTNDTSPKLVATLQDANGVAINVVGSTARFHMKFLGESTLKIDADAIITDGVNGVIQYSWVAGDTDTAGTCYGEIEITYQDGAVETFPNNNYFVIIIQEDLD